MIAFLKSNMMLGKHSVLAILLLITSFKSIAQTTLAQWNFNSSFTIPANGTAPAQSSGVSAGSSINLIGGITADDAVGIAADSGTPNNALNTTNYSAQSTNPKTAGIRINVNTIGYNSVHLKFYVRHSGSAARKLIVQYFNGTTWQDVTSYTYLATNTNFSTLQDVDLSASAAVNGNTSAQIRIVTDFSINNNYEGTTGAYGTFGSIRYDLVTITGNIINCNGVTSLPYFNGFENDSAGTAPNCLIKQDTRPDSMYSIVSNGGSWQGNRSLILTGPANYGTNTFVDSWLFLPAMNCVAGKEYNISFQYKGSYNYPINYTAFSVSYGTNPNALAMTTSLGGTIFWPNYYNFFSKFFSPGNGTFNIGIHFTSGGYEPNNLIIDNINVRENSLPSCDKSVTNLVAFTDGLNLNNAEINWNKIPNDSSLINYEWELRTTADPGSGNSGLAQDGTTSDTSITLNNLNPSIRYFVYVRPVCDGISAGSWSKIRLKTISPEFPGMALPLQIGTYNANPDAVGPISILDFPETGYTSWYSFIPTLSQLILQIRKKVNIFYTTLQGGDRPIFYKIYKANLNRTVGDSVASGSFFSTRNFPDEFCYNGVCQQYNSNNTREFTLTPFNPGIKYLIKFYQGDLQSGSSNNIVRSFEGGIYNPDVWFGSAIGDRATNVETKNINSGNNWIAFQSEDGKMHWSINPLGNNLGNVSGGSFRNTGTLSKNIYGTTIFDRNYRIVSNQIPSGNFKVRLYFTQSELQRFIDSTGKGLTDLRITQNNDLLYNQAPPYGNDNYFTGGKQITPTTGIYESYKYLEFETNQLGAFYIHGDSVQLPSVIQHPSSGSVCAAGSVIKLSSTAANGFPIPKVQWQQSVDNGITWSSITSAANADYTLIWSESLNGNMYRAAWSNTAGTVYSNPAVIRNKILPIITSTCCTGGNIVVTTNVGINHIIWLLNGSTVSSQSFNWPSFGVTSAGGNGSGLATNQFNNPFGVATDTAGNIYVADAGNNRVQKFTPGSVWGITVAGGNGAGAADNQLNNPRNVFVDVQGNLYVADAGNNRIQKWPNSATTGTTVAGGNGQGSLPNQLNFPHSVFLDSTGAIYVADANNNRIQKFTPGNINGTTVAGGNGGGNAANQLSYATGVYVNKTGSIYINDFVNNRIQKWIPGAVSGTTVAGGNGSGSEANQLSSPRGLFVDCNDNVYIADQNNNRIQKWPPSSTTGITIAGGNGEGNAINQLSSPASVYGDSKGNLFVADRLNHRIEQFSLPKTSSFIPVQAGAYKAVINSTECCSSTTISAIINAVPGPVICPGSSIYFISGNATDGNNYQWQVNTGSGYVNIVNNSIYSGATSDTLKLNTPSTSWYGYKYRSITNGSLYSPEYILKFAVGWTGNNNTAWENAANWTCGILPDENTDVTINTGLANYPLVNLNAVCGSLKLMPGTLVTIKTGVKLDVKRK